ncbi:MAG TPA: DUF6069 family protein [Actinomycetes bacterium]|jgi:hypothetical protein|nr:DUF6069 family protein [Actinomycetes bacterium]
MDTTTVAAPDAATRRRARLVAVVAAVGAALVLWAVVELAFGLDLRGPASGAATEALDVGPAQVVIVSLLAALAGWGLLAVLERLTSRARGLWAVIAVVVVIGSLGGPLSGTGVTAANRWALAGLHLVVGAVLIPTLYRTSPAGAAASGLENLAPQGRPGTPGLGGRHERVHRRRAALPARRSAPGTPRHGRQ